MERLGLKLTASHQEIAKTQAQLEQQAREAHELQNRLKSLMGTVKTAEERIKMADEQFKFRQSILTDKEEEFLDKWGNPAIPAGPNYDHWEALKASIKDFPRARARLVGLLEAAKKELAAFEKKHAL